MFEDKLFEYLVATDQINEVFISDEKDLQNQKQGDIQNVIIQQVEQKITKNTKEKQDKKM
ncbi:MAG: hypothetical protein PHE54_00375 [Bacilli bacterium]|nr:hypothetical protein [Bacilli bacterium]